MVRRFASVAEAERFIGPEVDRREVARVEEVGPGVSLAVRAVELGDGAFCNVYTACWRAPARASLCVVDPLESPFARAQGLARGGVRGVVATGGFFFLADDAEAVPRARSLNMAVRAGQVWSLPVVGQDALVGRDGALAVRELAAEGVLTFNGAVLRWRGSRAAGEAECVVYGNANVVIQHRADARTGKMRHFIKESRWTPEAGAGSCDVGFDRGGDGVFRGAGVAERGGLDIFSYDLVLRCVKARVRAPVGDNVVVVRSVGGLELGDPRLDSVISVGPSLLHGDLEGHPLHGEPSLGSTPLLGGRRGSRLLYFSDVDGACRLQLWDGRPGSAVCPGVTLDEAARGARAEFAVVEGCFLDSGRSGKLCVSDGSGVQSLGNRHYLRWPIAGDDAFVWTPDEGRPMASLVVITAG